METDRLKICFVASEVTPFAKTGGLADVAGSLGKYIKKAGHDIRLVMPFYDVIDTSANTFYPVEYAQNIEIHLGPKTLFYDIWTTVLPGSTTSVYLVHCPEMFSRGALYTNDSDEAIRFALLSRAAIELCQRMHWGPDVFHLNDWQTALLPVYLKTLYNWDKLFHNTKTLLTIHNLAYQGAFPADTINGLGLNTYASYFDASDLYSGTLNLMKTGLMHADKLSTVSPTYAREIQTQEFGEGLDGILRMRSGDLVGILNGVDYEEWNPKTDTYIPFNYTVKSVHKKENNKKHLLEKLGLPYRENVPLIGMIARLVSQKGLDLFEGVLDSILQQFDVQLVLLGSGEERYEQYLYYLQLNFPNRVVFYKGYDYPLSHLIEAGSDIFLMPSRFEPCGLNQIYSLKYGTIPVVRKTGGLADTIEPYEWQAQKGTGFVFKHYNSEGFYWALQYALTTYQYHDAWNVIRKRAMTKNFSWTKQTEKYISLYRKLE